MRVGDSPLNDDMVWVVVSLVHGVPLPVLETHKYQVISRRVEKSP